MSIAYLGETNLSIDNKYAMNDLTCNDMLVSNVQVGQNLFFVPTAVADFTGAVVTGLFPPSSSTQGIYVNKSGSDTTGDGSILNPYLTIGFALSQITDNTVLKPYSIYIGDGLYTEISPLVLKTNVNLFGTSATSCQIDCAQVTINSDWADGQQNFTRVDNIYFTSGTTIFYDLFSYGATSGYLVLSNCTCWGAVTIAGVGNTPNNSGFVAVQCTFIDTVIASQIFLQQYNCTYVGNLILNAGSVYDSQIWLSGCNLIGNLTLNSLPAQIPFSCTLFHNTMTNITSNADVSCPITINADITSLPIQANLSLNANTILNRLNDANGLAYSPSNPLDWTPIPITVSEALDTLASQSVDYGDMTPSTSNLVNIISIDSLIFRYQVIGNIVMINYILNATIPVVPSSPCTFDCSLPIALNNPALSEFEITGNMDISCNDGFNNPSNADKQYSLIQSIIGDNANCRFRFGIGASATSTSLMCTGTISYRL
jgi:hypothetical protein